MISTTLRNTFPPVPANVAQAAAVKADAAPKQTHLALNVQVAVLEAAADRVAETPATKNPVDPAARQNLQEPRPTEKSFPRVEAAEARAAADNFRR